MIAERWLRGQFRLQLVACVLLVGAPFWPQLGIAAGGVLAVSALLLWGNLLSALRRFARHVGGFS
jgi:hypothetical protein